MPGVAGPSAERWSDFSVPQQILMIANDLNRASKWMGAGDLQQRRGSYARALALTDLTAAGAKRLGFRKELLRWRELLAGLYLDPSPDPATNRELLRILLRFSYESSRQIPHTPGLAP